MTSIAVLSNPLAHGNKSELVRVRQFCERRPDVAHHEVRRDQLAAALRDILAAKPRLLAINGGDGTVQAVLTELFRLGCMPDDIPPLAVLPNGTTNLVAKDAGYVGDSIRALSRCCEIARNDLAAHLIERQLICMTGGGEGDAPVIGMFLGAGGLVDTILHCRHRIYPIGLPAGVSHALGVLAGLTSILTGRTGGVLPPPPSPVVVSNGTARLEGRFQVVMVTTLHRLVLSGTAPLPERGKLRALAIDRRRRTGLRIVAETLIGRLGRAAIPGVHWLTGEEIRIEAGWVILDGEEFEGKPGQPFVLRPLPPVQFVDLSS